MAKLARAARALDEDDMLSAINTTPLVDVMLVLLIIFLITIPAVTASVRVDLPKERIETRETRPDNVIISVDRAGDIYWHEVRVGRTEALVERLKALTARHPQPEVQIRGDFGAQYDGVGRVLYACQRAGITKVAFITEPPSRGG